MMSEPGERCGVCGQKAHREDNCDLITLKATMLVKDRIPPVKARLTLPPCLSLVEGPRGKGDDAELEKQSLHSGEWVEVIEDLPRGTWFGPLDTPKTRHLRGNPRIKLASIENRGGLPLWYDTSDPTVCNWMMLVPISKKSEFSFNEEESSSSKSNLLVVEHQGKVYFVTPRKICQGERLMAAYSPSYEKAIGKLLAAERKRFGSKISNSASQKRAKSRSSVENEPSEVIRYICADCSICFQTEVDIQQHVRRVHRNKRDNKSKTKTTPSSSSNTKIPGFLSAVEPAAQYADEAELHETRSHLIPQELQPQSNLTTGRQLAYLEAQTKTVCSLISDVSEGTGAPQDPSMKALGDVTSGQEEEEVGVALPDKQEVLDTLTAMGNIPVRSNSQETREEAGGLLPVTSALTNPVTRSGAACHICLKWLSSATTLRSHTRACQLPGESEVPDGGECRYCGLNLTSLPEYRRHVLSHLLEHECPLCRARFRLESVMISHACPCLRNCRELTIEHRCDVCEIDVGNLISTELHLRLGCQGHRRPHKCGRCEQSFFLQSSLDRHLCLLSGEEGLQEIDPETTGPGFICESCGALLSSTSALNKHRATHASPAFSCAECGKSFHRRDGLEGHMTTHRRRRERRQEPQLGLQPGQQPQGLNEVGEAPAAKDTSAVTTTSSETVTRSPTSNAHSCNICGKRLSTRASLRVHLRGHGSSCRFRCPHCERGYNQKSNLEKHLISAHQSVKFWCGECHRSFTSKESLDLHSLDHQGASREYRCSLCPAAFHRAYQLRRHLRHLHNGRVFSCPLCASSMKLASSLLRHLRSIHPDRPDVAAQQAEEIANLYKTPPVPGTDGILYEAQSGGSRDDLEAKIESVEDYSVEAQIAAQDISNPALLEESNQLHLSLVTEEETAVYP